MYIPFSYHMLCLGSVDLLGVLAPLLTTSLLGAAVDFFWGQTAVHTLAMSFSGSTGSPVRLRVHLVAHSLVIRGRTFDNAVRVWMLCLQIKVLLGVGRAIVSHAREQTLGCRSVL